MPSLPTASETRPVVYKKLAWADSWVESPLLHALTIADQAAPGHSSATLQWRYGKTIQPEIGSRPADDALTMVTTGDFDGNYIKIVLGSMEWYGIIQDRNDDRRGMLDGTTPTGIENYTAFGLTWLLDQVPITQSKVKTAAGSAIINRAIPFNGGTDGSDRKNRIAGNNFDGTANIFSDRDLTNPPAAWTAADAVNYLLTNFAPLSSAGTVLVPFALAAGAAAYLDYELPRVEYHGQTVWAILNRIIDRKRGLGWHAVIASGTVTITVWSQNQTSITLPSGGTIPANANQASYNFDSSVNVKSATVSTTLLRRYDQVICIGERAGSVFTVKPLVNMVAGWKSAEADTYNEAATGLADYDDLSDADKQAANHDRRAADDLAKVFSWYVLKKDWDGKAYLDSEYGGAPFAIPKIDADGVAYPATLATYQRSGLRFQTFLPMRAAVDYTGTITPETDEADEDSADYLPPFVLFKAPVIRSSNDDGWIHCERLNQASLASSSKRPYTYSVDLSVLEDAPGIAMKTVGAPQHYIAEDLYEPNDDFEAIPEGEGFDVDEWLATVYVLHDQYCRAQYPFDGDLPTLDLVRPLLLQIPQAYLDFIIPGTIVGVEGGKLKRTAAGGQLRDDRHKLLDIARLAYAWHGQWRRTLNLSFRSIVPGFSLGNLITDIGTGVSVTTINTCITSVVYDLQAGTTQLTTQFGELDFTI